MKQSIESAQNGVLAMESCLRNDELSKVESEWQLIEDSVTRINEAFPGA
jgi:hypothetical protein